MMRKLAHVFALAVLAITSSGCVGVMVSHTERQVMQRPNIYATPSSAAVYTPAGATNECLTALKLREVWGPAAKVKSDADAPGWETWTYKFQPVWCGLIPCVIVPVPLVLPLAREQVVFVIENGQVKSAVSTQRTWSGCGYAFISPCGARAF